MHTFSKYFKSSKNMFMCNWSYFEKLCKYNTIDRWMLVITVRNDNIHYDSMYMMGTITYTWHTHADIPITDNDDIPITDNDDIPITDNDDIQLQHRYLQAILTQIQAHWTM